MHVLLVKMSSLGDVVHTLPALTDAAANVPGIRFDWVVEEAFAEIPAWHPAVDKVIPIALRRWRKHLLRELTGPEWRDCRNQLRRGHYDAVIDAQGLLKSALVARLVKAPIFGLDRHSAREGLAALAYQHRIAVPRDMHAVERTRSLFATALNYPLPASRGDYGVREGLMGGKSHRSGGLLFFHGTARAEKLWPEDHWIELARLAGAADYPVWLPWGSEQERERAERIASACDSASVLPRLDLVGIAGLLLEANGAVAVDTGLGHLAAALDVPTVSLYGPTSTRLIGAYGKNQVHIESRLGLADTSDPLAMMRSITPAQVWSELQPVIGGPQS
ncbi:lipopolysaccharide heptosyltransferase I [Seongchinamella sediminis]|uniref:Lipopolysaccharide heptosyltransferase 1 n=1 Tax=Seongchinamella sediminis TaxID=2283635 RepID=A0A3L7DX39_9GAMM|nr:lipopolysaccharide heptosyltransferase I [Seongchinamella sediminis]RLQ22127.1 lipopolysaccharide heptosyltransferase I [Seongchinamella sediminis]